MSVLMVPDDEIEWPTLGGLICDYIEANLVFGPGDLEHLPAKLDPEKRALIYRFYEVFPEGAKDANGKSIAGRRRFRRCAISLQKGSAKTELAAWIAIVELAPDGPVRCAGFDSYHRPVGRPVPSPYIPLVSYALEMTEDLCYGVMKDILEHSRISSAFDIGLERITRAGEPRAKAVALAGAPDSRDGALTTFSHKDETHRWTSLRQKRAHRTMIANLPKRLMADPWELETTTAYSPGEESVAEDTAAYAQAVAEGRITDSRLFFFHRQASDGYDWTDEGQRRKALVEAAGPTAGWKDIEGISELWQDPKQDVSYLERVYGNRPVAAASQAFDRKRWDELVQEEVEVPAGELITIGFDGAIRHDGTALVGTHVRTGFQWVIGCWEEPNPRDESWEVPADEVDNVLRAAFERWNVWRLYADPPYWEGWIATWQGRWGDDVVVEWRTNRYFQMAWSLRAYRNAMIEGDVSHDGDAAFARHVGNARKLNLNFRDDQDQPMWIIHKERPDSPDKIDLAMAGCLSWEARSDAVSEGMNEDDGESVYEHERLMIL